MSTKRSHAALPAAGSIISRCILGLGLIGCAANASDTPAESPGDTPDAKAEVRAWFDAMNDAFERNDHTRVRSLVAKDAVYIVPGFGRMGREMFAQGASRTPEINEKYAFSGRPAIEEIRVYGDVAYVISKVESSVTERATNETTSYSGHTLSILEKRDGTWVLVRDMNTVEEVSPSAIPRDATVISDFEAEPVTSTFGSGWSIATDAMEGGSSRAAMTIAKPGAGGSAGALSVSGNVVRANSPRSWAGVLFSPGGDLTSPADLSSKSGLRFRARGDDGTYSIMVFTNSRGWQNPATQSFDTESEWATYEFELGDFGTDGSDVLGVFWGAVAPGKFSFQLDRVELW